jgi:hypothetical protein
MPSMLLPPTTSAFAFYAWYETEGAWDYCNVKISTDGGLTFNVLTPLTGYDDPPESGYLCPLMINQPGFNGLHGAWALKAFSLAGYEGQNAIFSFDFGSDGSTVGHGFYLDDVTILRYPYATAQGHVYEADGITPVDSALVVVVNASNDTVATMYTGPDGSFTKDFTHGTYTFYCSKAGYISVTVIVIIDDDVIIIVIIIRRSGCTYIPGDINGNGVANGIDVVYGVSYFKGGNVPPNRCDVCPQPQPFYAAGDVNANCVFNGIDITYFVAYLKGNQPALRYCPTCPPASLAAPPVLEVEPIRGPDLKIKGIIKPQD